MGLLLAILFAIYASGATLVIAFLWRRQDQLNAEVAALRSALEARANAQAQVVRRRARGAAIVLPLEAPPAAAADDRVRVRAAGLPAGVGKLASPPATQSAETIRGLALGLLATAPAFGFFLHADAPAIIASGLAVAAAMMIVSLRPVWAVAAWASVFTAGGWASLGFALGAAHADPISYSICVTLAAGAGLLHAHLRRAPSGATMALTMSAAALALASQTGMIGPAGGAFGVIVALGAIVGAMRLRLEAIHLAAFGAAVIGLFVLSGQDAAAIWFTPVTTWMGALFLGIATIRVPQLGSRGVAIAGTGGFGALGAVLALNGAQQGLANPYAAAGALLVLAGILAAVIAASALRLNRGLQALRFSLWMLAVPGFIAIWAAIVLALPAPLASAAFGLVALGFAVLNARFPSGAWRLFTGAAACSAGAFAIAAAHMLVTEAPDWSGSLLILLGLCAPAALVGGGALIATRHDAPKLAGLLELLTVGLAVSAASLFVRLLFSDGAFRLHSVGFVETGVHSAVWLLAAILIGSRAHVSSMPMRMAAANLLMIAALGVMAIASLLWVTDYWIVRGSAGSSLLSRETLGFLIPSIMFFAHWVFWRARSDDLQTRLAFGASTQLLAAFVTAEALGAGGLPEWLRALIGAAAFALALGLNFAPGVVNADPAPARRQLHKYFHRDRRGQQRRQAREHAS